jgi:predicted transposase/invertase (TIGR01784 family)
LKNSKPQVIEIPVGTLLPVKSDVIFRIFFADERDTESLIKFLKSVIHLPDDEYEVIEITDPHLIREHVDDKLAVIDVKLRTKNKKTIHIEIQLKVTDEFLRRVVYYSSNLITEQIGDGGKYRDINNVITIVITDENFVNGSNKYHHRFAFADLNAGVELTDLVEIHTLELRKLPEVADGSQLYDWASFINAETKEELEMIATRNPDFRQPVVKLQQLSESEENRRIYARRLQALRDKAMIEDDAERRGVEKGVKAADEKWQGVIAEQAALIADLQAQLANRP